ncbi:unnamed protein product [Rotaria socialis]
MSLDKVTIKLVIVNVLMSRKKFDAALTEFSEIIDHFIKDDSWLQDAQVVDTLTNSCITRININFDKKRFEDVLFDMEILAKAKYDIYTGPEMFLKKSKLKLN